MILLNICRVGRIDKAQKDDGYVWSLIRALAPYASVALVLLYLQLFLKPFSE